MNIGLFGGTFDPPHIGHLIVAEQARAQLGLDQVWFTPAGQPVHKSGQHVTAVEHRIEMTRLAIEGNSGFALCLDDATRPGPHYTLTLLDVLESRYPRHAWQLIIGSDSLRDLSKWHQPEALVARIPLAVAHRPGMRPSVEALEAQIPGLGARVRWIDSPQVDASSHDLRDRIRAGQSVRYAVPDAVVDYARKHALFGLPGLE